MFPSNRRRDETHVADPGACAGKGGEGGAGETVETAIRSAGIKPIQIYPGSPWENGYNERFNGTLRREVLNAEWFSTIRQAQAVINA